MATVAELITAQVAAVDATSAQADGFLTDLLEIANVSFGKDEFGNDTSFNINDLLPNGYEYAKDESTWFPVFSTTRPSIPAVATNPPPTAPASTFSALTDVAVPVLAASAPVLAFPSAPATTLPAAPGAAPVFVSPDIPTAPLVNLPTVPTFASLQLPDSPTIDLPSFTAALPSDDLLTPTASFQFYEAAYESTLLDPLKAKLLDDLVNGGYGIDTADEIALFNRARDREVEAAFTRIEEAGSIMAGRGFPLPPGELAVHMDRAWQDMQNKVSSASRDITLERSKLFVENRQFTIVQVKETEQILLGFHSAVQERALNVAKLTVEMSIALYNASLAKFNARLEAYKTEAVVFGERIRGELAKADIYRTQIEAAGVQVQVQRQLVDVYLAQLRGVEVSVDIFKTQMEAANIQSQIERTRMEAFQSQINAYTAQVQAKVAEFGLYRAQIDGEIAKVTAFEAQVRAYNGEVQAVKTQSDIQLGRLQSETEQARIKLAGFQGELAVYEADVRRQLESGRLVVDTYRADIEQNRVLTDGYRANAELKISEINATVQQNIQINTMAIENAKAKLIAAVEALKFKTSATQYASEKFYAQLTAMLGSINTLAVQTAAE